jgi:hypothetical protein
VAEIQRRSMSDGAVALTVRQPRWQVPLFHLRTSQVRHVCTVGDRHLKLVKALSSMSCWHTMFHNNESNIPTPRVLNLKLTRTNTQRTLPMAFETLKIDITARRQIRNSHFKPDVFFFFLTLSLAIRMTQIL